MDAAVDPNPVAVTRYSGRSSQLSWAVAPAAIVLFAMNVVIFAAIPLGAFVGIRFLVGSLLATASAITLAAFGGLWVMAARARFLLRMFPIAGSGSRSRFVMVVSACLAAIAATDSTLRLFGLDSLHGHSSLVSMMAWAEGKHLAPVRLIDASGFPVGVDAALEEFFSWAAPLGLLCAWHSRGVDALGRQPFALFLRRFSSFADRTVVASMMAALPVGTRAAFLTGPRGERKNWDTLTISFSGLRWERPLADLPLFLSTADASWLDVVKKLVDRAACIVIDVSGLGASLEQEVQLIRAVNATSKTVWMCDKRDRDAVMALRLDEETARTAIQYEKSWLAALPRLGATLVLMGVGTLGAVLSIASTELELASKGSFDWRFAMGHWLVVFVVYALPTWLFLFCRRSLTKGDEAILKQQIDHVVARRRLTDPGH